MNNSLFLLFGSAFVFGLSLLYAFTNGLRNAPLIMATVVSTRAVTPGQAFLLCAAGEFVGTVFLGSAVVATISQQMFGGLFGQGSHLEVLLVLTATIGAAIIWGSVCYLRAIPTSNSHALFAGFTGASWAAWGSAHLFNTAMISVFALLVLSPLVALVLTVLLTYLVRWAGEWLTPKAASATNNLHILSSLLAASADGSNNGQMAISVVVLAWGLVGKPAVGNVLFVPTWIKLSVGGLISLGVLMGGRRIVKRLGMSFYRIEILQGLSAQLTSALVMLACITQGYPASTSHVITGSILGAGAAKNPRNVRWGLATDILLSWVITFPAVGLLSILIYHSGAWMAHP